jgi:hypothetical protein
VYLWSFFSSDALIDYGRRVLQHIPFQLAFGLEAIMPSKFIVSSLQIKGEHNMNESKSKQARAEQKATKAE